jgi:hypothetical protein
METLKLLRKQVLTAWKSEETLPPDIRRLYSWQFVCRHNDIPYLVGKGDANTFYYSINGNDIQYVMPSEMLDILNGWVNSKYTLYAITRTKKIKTKHTSTNLDNLLSVKIPKLVGYFIVGIKSDGSVVRLYRLTSGLKGVTWIKFKGK